jgi:PAS domain S-box-containing protein
MSLLFIWLFGGCFIFLEGNRLNKLAAAHNQALENVKEIKERLEFVVEGSRVGTWEWNVTTGEFLFNERMTDMLGYTPVEIKPHISSLEKLLHPDDLEKTMQTVTDLLENRIPNYMAEHRLRHKSGQWVWILAVGKVLQWSQDGKPLRAVGIQIDITEQKEQEAYRLKSTLQNEQLVRLESLKTMAGAIAHRFNNAMMTVQGNLELMTCTFPVDSSEYKMASDAAKAAIGASQVGSMMLSYVGQQPLKLQNVPLETLVRESVTSLKSLLQPSISLQFTPPDRPLYCSVDQKQIKEVIVSIITNAVESLNDGSGTIEITFGTDYFTTDSFPISFLKDNLQDGMYTFCQIKDSGHGIKPKDLSRIFEPFYTTRFVGRGLGLALTVGIMQSHHGALIVESQQAKGTTVRVLLPPISSTQQTTIPSDDVIQSEIV